MKYDNTILVIVQILLIAGAINWGLVAYNKTDAVTFAVGEDIGRYVKFAVALAGIYYAYTISMQ